ncbi:pentatricopeptide repeat-containing protein At3g14580, mitochondrial-like [Nymphaea colorata]|uniref:Pentacotripeptide-repeat region of PRORP domain-containing protein n=1 Tax=Nymphaea colorata TaxID=210225 RepID=A0A5K0ZVL4_9MAGN|nr:pentatricopeptide repeat-containing protein At3g14580, mitochondrial-like [Nymphaea colorata]XP_031474958.1 pentatricopeptide repeat-containing protein At3g14580, mitochondrial-like [Nymphaea colorata]XP_031474959.1 pentatricopeptide repeat-containing protein At3g14580, mitochondrial-like [Nymphaea colorata]
MGAHWMVFRNCCNKFHFHFRKFGPIQKLRIPIVSLSTLAQVRPDINRVDHKDWLSPNEVLKVFNGIRDPQLLISTFHKVSLRKDYKPNEALYSIIMERLAYAQMFDAIEDILVRIKMERCTLSDEFFRNLIKLFAHVGNNPERAVRALYEMPKFRCWPTVATFNCVLNMLVCTKRYETMHEVYLRASRLGVKLDACCFNILIKALCQLGKMDAAYSLVDEMPKQGCKPNRKTYATLMHYLCEQGNVDEAFQLYERTDRAGCHHDTITFNILISGLCKQKRVAEGMDLLDKMKGKGCLPNSGSYLAVIYGLLDMKKSLDAKEYLYRMISEGSAPSFKSFKLLIQGLCTERLLDDAELVLREMIRHGFVPRMGTWRRLLNRMFPRAGNTYVHNDVVDELTQLECIGGICEK